MIAAALLPPLVFLVFVAIWRVVGLLIMLWRATREDREPIHAPESSREAAKRLLDEARLEFEAHDAGCATIVTMNWPMRVDYLSLCETENVRQEAEMAAETKAWCTRVREIARKIKDLPRREELSS